MLNSVAGGLSQTAESNANNGRAASEKFGGILGAVRSFFSGGANKPTNSFGAIFGGAEPAYPDIQPVSLTPVVPGHQPRVFEPSAFQQTGNDFQYFNKSSDFAGIGESAAPPGGESHSNLNNPWNLMFS